ncbi:TIGR00645 family protein [Nitrospirillum sp. BR 11164]|uniref:TIGR00645 family protein n=1 Tax=Nitrospirillum sp. BR 11164 TaxID=3104324 RepID=UPI002AFF33E5|nr:TIGR00645 family protein [Nitrospirillum sp. BR 11164]MEA1651969.1 TIGR00645 family protein [Nitrospirillum sp. BR 11164]
MDRWIESVLFASRWLLAPLYIGLVVALLLPLAGFVHELWELINHLASATSHEIILGLLSLIDLSLIANLVLMVIFAGYENFVSKISVASHHDRLEWMGEVDFGGLKLRLIASIVAISGIQLLRAFMSVSDYSDRDLMWSTVIHVVFVMSGVLLALMDYLTEKAHKLGH